MFNIRSLSPQKRPAEFAETIADVCSRRDDLYCLMARKGPKADAVAEYTSDQLKTVGYVSEEDKWHWFAHADLFASLSAYEGMPVATLEALSFGLPVILSDIAAHRAVVDEHDATGECVSIDPEAILTAIHHYEGESADVSLPSWSDVASQYLKLVE